MLLCEGCCPCYLHLPIFLYIHTPVLLQNKKFLCRLSQIACTVTTMNITWTQATLHENPCTVLGNSSMLKLFEFANLFIFFCSILGWLHHSVLAVRTINCENCQLSTGAINLSQLRTTFHLPTPLRPFWFKEIRKTTTTAFLISNTGVPNPNSHSIAFDNQSLALLS